MKSLFFKMLIVFGLVVTASVLVLGTIVTILVEKELNSSVIQLALSTVQARSQAFSEWVHARIGELEGLSAINAIAQLKKPDALNTLKEFRSTKASIYDLLFYGGLDGIGYTTTDATPDISNRSYYIALKDGNDIAISEPIISRATGQPVFVIAKAIKSDNTFIGFVAGSIELKTITSTAEALKLTEKGENEFGFILTKDGVPLAFPDDNIRMNISFTKDTEITKDEIKQAYASWEMLKPAAKEMAAGKTGSITFYRNNKQFICFFTPIAASPGWSLGIVVPA